MTGRSFAIHRVCRIALIYLRQNDCRSIFLGRTHCAFDKQMQAIYRTFVPLPMKLQHSTMGVRHTSSLPRPALKETEPSGPRASIKLTAPCSSR